jgi:CTD small phosphatase-like protein 2
LFSPALKYDGDAKHEGHEHADHHDIEDIIEEEEHLDEYVDEEEEDDEEVFNPYLFIAGLPPHSSVVIKDKICLPPLPTKGPQARPTLALDLDETLVHCTVEPIPKPDLTFPVTFNGTFYQVYVRKRPYLDYFLETVSKSFEVVVFTASQKVYADVLLDLLDPERKFIEHRLFREACLFVQGNYLKDLSVLGRDMRRVSEWLIEKKILYFHFHLL